MHRSVCTFRSLITRGDSRHRQRARACRACDIMVLFEVANTVFILVMSHPSPGRVNPNPDPRACDVMVLFEAANTVTLVRLMNRFVCTFRS